MDDGSIEDPELAARASSRRRPGCGPGRGAGSRRFYTAPGFASELMHLYLATDLRPADGERLTPDEDEHLLVERMPWRDAVAAAERGELRDGKTLLGLLWLRAARRLTRERPRRRRAGRPTAWRAPRTHRGAHSGSDALASTVRRASRWPARGRAEPVERVAVQRRVRAERDGESQVGARLLPPAEPLQALAEGEMAVVRRGIDLEQRLERRARSLGLAGVEVGAAERLEDRALARLEPVGPLEHDGGLGEVTSLEQILAALEQLVGALALVGVGAFRRAAKTACADGGTERATPPALDVPHRRAG